MSRLRTRYMAVLAGIAAMAIAGCGSSSSKSKTPAASTPAATPSTPSTTGTTGTSGGSGFVAQWSAVCSQLKTKAPGAKTNAQVAALLEQTLVKLQAIHPPAAQQANYQKLLSVIKQEASDLTAGNTAAVRQLGASTRSLEAKLGLPKCS